MRDRRRNTPNRISRGMVEGECMHRENLIPKTALSSQKAALEESNLKRYGRGMVERWQRNLQSSSESSTSEISSAESSASASEG